MTARKMKGAWWVDFHWTHRLGPAAGTRERVRRKSPVDTKRGAEEYERLLRTRLLEGKPLDGIDPKAKVVPKFETWIDEWLEVYVDVHNKPSTASTKRGVVSNHLKPFFGKLRLDEIGIKDIERFKAAKTAEGLNPKSVNNFLSMLRRALVSAVEWEEISHVPPIKWLKAPPPTFDFFDHAESERLLRAAPDEDRAILTTAVRAGLRLGELLALRWEDVDFVTGKILVRRAVWKGKVSTPKSGKHREVAMSPQLAATLRAHQHLRGPLVFCKPDGSMLTKEMTKRIVPRACRRAGLRELQWHALRHSFASQLVMAGVPLKAVQELLGHSTIEMTMRYAHLSPTVHVDAVARLDAPPQLGHRGGVEARTETPLRIVPVR